MRLRQNVGQLDRVVRAAGAMSLIGLAVAGIPGGPAAFVTVTLAFVLLATAVTGFCPLYALLGIRTARDVR